MLTIQAREIPEKKENSKWYCQVEMSVNYVLETSDFKTEE